uniref:BED-type domain-containing protein n=1 Tax=Chenopodium quinoa TaxID=63459 RepID=A0A803N9M1_CHEQI
MDTHVHQLSSGEEEEIDSTIKDKGKGKNQNTSSDKPRLILTGKKRPRRLSSGVWVHFEFLDEPDENGNLICKCKKCGLRFNGDSKNGTGNLHRHLKNCKQRSFRDVGQMILEKTSSGLGNRLPDFDAGYFRELLSIAIVEHDMPFQFVEFKALIHFQKVDANYVHCPSAEEWGRIEKICKFLKVFHDVTLAFSGTKYPTSNLYFHRVLQVRLLLQNEMKSSDLFMQKMACKMYEKFGKYWSEFSTFMVVSVVLDPRYKLQCVNWGYMRIYGQHSIEYELEFSKVKDALRRLYEAYESTHSSSSKAIPTTNASNEASDDFMMDFDSFSQEQSSVAIKSEIDMYYEEPLIPRGTNLDILSSLKSETVEAIICLRDWAFGEANMDPQMEMLCGSVMKLKVEDNNDNHDTPRSSPELEQFDENASSNIV